MDVEQIQHLIKKLQHQLNWKFSTLVEVLYVELNDDDDSNKQTRFSESLKKQLSRKTTPKEKLERYLQIIKQHPDFKKLNLVHNTYIKTDDVISKTVAAGIKKISIDLDKQLEKDEFSSHYDDL